MNPTIITFFCISLVRLLLRLQWWLRYNEIKSGVNIYADFMEICATAWMLKRKLQLARCYSSADSLSIEVRECNCDRGGKKIRYYRWELQMCENVAFRGKRFRLVLNFTFISNFHKHDLIFFLFLNLHTYIHTHTHTHEEESD